jgi:hypothetical protein
MAWNVEGRYFENCSCDAPCPCTASMTLGADYDKCEFLMAFHVDSGEVDGVDVSGLSVAAVGSTPKFMNEGNWRIGLLIDAAASDEQAEKLGALFGGALGGPMAALGPLMGEQLGLERVPIEFSSENGRHSVSLGEAGRVDVEDIVPWGAENGEAVRYSGVFHPLGPDLTLAKAGDSRLSVFGLEPELAGKSGFSQSFSWSA